MSFKRKIEKRIRFCMTAVSPKLNTAVLFRVKKNRRIRLNDPQSFEEKLLKLKLEKYNHDPLVKRCADKYAVRSYVTEKGFGNILNKLIAVYDSPEELEWERLPNRFVLKLNVGCGCNYICTDKENTDKNEVAALSKKWMKTNHWLGYAELQYKGVPKKLLVEKYLENESGGAPDDYKIYCFNGQPEAILFMDGRFSGEMRVGFFDTSWRYLGIKQNHKKSYKEFDKSDLPQKPRSLDQMIEAARALSAGFPFVRADFFEVNGNPVFGELTFTPSGGFDPSEVDVNGKSMAELLQL